MTKRERTYYARLKAREQVLLARLALTPETASFRVEIQKEYDAMKWACEKLGEVLAREDRERLEAEQFVGYL